MSNFHSLEVVGRGSETQLQVGDNLNYFIQLIYFFPHQPLVHLMRVTFLSRTVLFQQNAQHKVP